uniref:Flagellar brake protein YcgR 1 n=1 Tax=Dechloromonas aromatica (strain RCB) TaxID=159087 RepID=YCGR1_DECAR|nr:RecName: Full=Flagellar brake protein YcgR 1; AltName: Full=Cyclic di-GMP binding protein YcgR 1 [Dechloromonas aromatica RCB]
MSSTQEDQPNPDFEIDHPEAYSQYFLTAPREISFYLNLLVKRGSLLTAHIDDGKAFFLTTMIAVDDEKQAIFLDSAQADELNTAAKNAHRITLTAKLDRVKIQLRLPPLRHQLVDGQKMLVAAFPQAILRIQRREFFRLESSSAHPILCRIAMEAPEGTLKTFEWNVADISGGGLSLNAPTSLINDCQRDALFKNSRLDIPGEGVLLVNLRVRKTSEFSAENGQHYLRVGCEFVELPGSRLAMIERYIARIERERKARDSGLAN